jgi:hypothetical protein
MSGLRPSEPVLHDPKHEVSDDQGEFNDFHS